MIGPLFAVDELKRKYKTTIGLRAPVVQVSTAGRPEKGGGPNAPQTWNQSVSVIMVQSLLGLVPYAPLGRSMLTGTVHGKADLPEGDRRLQHPRFQGEALDNNVALAKRLEAIAAEKRCTPAQLVLAWLLAQGKDVIPIPGTKRRERIDENLAALSIKLSLEELRKISDAAPPGAGAGTRYPAETMKRVYL